MSAPQVHGFADPRFAKLEEVFAASLISGADLGGAVAVTVGGETVVDLWGGWTDAARTSPWAEDTLVNVFSVSKTLTALVALVLIDKGLLDPARPVSHYWPEFAAAGKDRVTVAQVLSHSAGLSGWRDGDNANHATVDDCWRAGRVACRHMPRHGARADRRTAAAAMRAAVPSDARRGNGKERCILKLRLT